MHPCLVDVCALYVIGMINGEFGTIFGAICKWEGKFKVLFGINQS